ncbi:hypothetical protein DCC81_03365 [Chitinophaga parva]|uniref:Phage integrase SAM-like domain-containing protein n=1 Tax=Chitinophaga parva TaxID=2169414 RepID=A0A2T7BLH7_9BACT|nr:phage integrase SAM-like domain-containing protein [Chitinophaga parva]PUZ28533.1 hypothetical protein DCC81_03365 [Chitinophaga parva]
MGVSIKAVHNWRNVLNANGRYPVHIYVYIDGPGEKYYPVKLPQKPSIAEWGGVGPAWVKPTSPYAFQSNKVIQNTIDKITAVHKRMVDANRKLAHYHIEKELNFKGTRIVVNDYFKNYIDNPPELVQLEESTWEKYASFLQHLNKFNPKLRFEEIDVEMAARIRNYLAAQPGIKTKTMAPASVKSLFDKFIVILQHAANEDKLIEKDVVDQITRKVFVDVPDREEGLHWDVIDVRNFKKLPEFALQPSQVRDKKLFLLQIYGCWYYNDLFYMRRDDVHYDHEFGMYVTGRRSKNEVPRLIPLWSYPDAEGIMKEFEDADKKSTFWFRRDAFVESQTYNRNIKVLAEMAGVTREVTAKIARHTGMTLLSRVGLQYPALKKAAGQKMKDVGGVYIKMGLREMIDATALAGFEKLAI